MKHREGDKVRVIAQEFNSVNIGHNVWVVDHIKKQGKSYPTLYSCYREEDRHKTMFQFTEAQIVNVTRTLENISKKTASHL